MPTKTKNGSSSTKPATTPAAPGEGTPALTPEQVVKPPASNGAAAGPMLMPPGTATAGVRADAASSGLTATTSAKIGGLWCNNAQNNAWAYLNGVGWRRISPANATSHQAMLQILRVARDASAQVQCEEDGSVIHSLYAW